ncbi:glucosaminidase domain-containing protein [Ktedonobacter robiniae]|uniref:Mannosyl-glycoprotein endo-beta-N-acetylglucosamidase-like domain-containing protein n=1 Tax=Ktedonobacter robiniae TaxID=2778365 RepID=A0ABQ3UIB3_9CHLR|nr:glucosaminidase domain-containing protein [Ktedonobacter robiniae]GHO52182.1 hypothetical protein KSB_06570 [Ktedonobacter robiniae]
MSRFINLFGLLLIIGAFTVGLAWYSSAPLVKRVKASVNASSDSVVRTSSDTASILGTPTISAAFIDQVLAHYGSPAAGTGKALYEDGGMYGIDPAFALAFFWHESKFGLYGAAHDTKSLGNIICTSGYPSCIGRFRAYSSWAAGYLDWFRLLKSEYIPRGLTTVDTIIPVYAPGSENNVPAYVSAVKQMVVALRSGHLEV